MRRIALFLLSLLAGCRTPNYDVGVSLETNTPDLWDNPPRQEVRLKVYVESSHDRLRENRGS